MPHKKLIYVVPGLNGQERHWEPLLARLKKEPGFKDGTEAHWEFWPHGLHALSFRRLTAVAIELKAKIDETVVGKGPFSEIILVGHSVGALLVREAYLRASNAYLEVGTAVRDSWATLVTKLILFASISRCIDPERTV